jgi:hypothetical protein
MIHAMTTIEGVVYRAQMRQQEAILTARYGRGNQIIKQNVRQHWQFLWGDLRTEGNRWWIGGRWNEFAKVMGSRWLQIIRMSSLMRDIQEGQI